MGCLDGGSGEIGTGVASERFEQGAVGGGAFGFEAADARLELLEAEGGEEPGCLGRWPEAGQGGEGRQGVEQFGLVVRVAVGAVRVAHGARRPWFPPPLPQAPAPALPCQGA